MHTQSHWFSVYNIRLVFCHPPIAASVDFRDDLRLISRRELHLEDADARAHVDKEVGVGVVITHRNGLGIGVRVVIANRNGNRNVVRVGVVIVHQNGLPQRHALFDHLERLFCDCWKLWGDGRRCDACETQHCCSAFKPTASASGMCCGTRTVARRMRHIWCVSRFTRHTTQHTYVKPIGWNS